MTDLTPTETKDRLKSLGLFGLLACWEQLADKPWLREVLAIEERERHKRSLERRLKNSRVAAFKPMTDFDWSWPKKIDREAVDDLFGLGFLATGHNAVLVGPNGVGKTMILKNLAHQAVIRGHTVRFSTASDMLADLAGQESSVALARRLRRYTVPALLCIDEVGYLSYDSRYADLLFEVVTRRYDAQKPLLLSTNKAFADWGQVFPHAACVVTLVDRLVHRAEVPARAPRRGDRDRGRELPAEGSQGAQRHPHQAAPHQEALSGLFTGELHRHPAWSSPAPAAGFTGALHRNPAG